LTSTAKPRIGVFGGTFDPPHAGHLELALTVLGSGQVDRMLLVPCFRHAFGKAPVAFEHRVAMCALLAESVDGLEVSDAEARLEHPGRTLDLIIALEEAHPGCPLRLVAGGDIYFEREKWYRFLEVERRAPPIYVARRGLPPLPVPSLPAPSEVSSSAIREALAAGRPPRGLLPPAVAEYVERHGLYGVRG
jgi:nicotinate-nucleotide adenylyltransferase